MRQIIISLLLIFFFSIILSCSTDCSKEQGYHLDCGCPDGQTLFNKNCSDSENYAFYFGSVDFYCFQDSIAIGIDVDNKIVQPYSFDEFGLTVYGSFRYDGNVIEVMQDECQFNSLNNAVFLVFNDKTVLDKLHSEIILDLFLKESAFFGSNTIDSTQISVKRR